MLFVASLGAEFLANDKPLIASYKGQLLFPIFFDYPEDMFGGFQARDRLSRPLRRRRDQGARLDDLAAGPLRQFDHHPRSADAAADAADLAADRRAVPHGAREAEVADAATVPRPCSKLEPLWLGSDQDGHDIVARLLYGFRISVLFGLILAGVSSVIGVFAGAVQGYFGGLLDLMMQRVIEIWSSLPHLYILIILSAILAPSFVVLLVSCCCSRG